jgi:hypothetical protein
MGCDYYTWIETVIVYKDLSDNRCEFVEEVDFDDYKRNYDYSSGSYDPDVEDPPENPLERDKRLYGANYLYCNNMWVCKEAGIQRVKGLLEEQKIPLDSVVEVYKRMDGYWR